MDASSENNDVSSCQLLDADGDRSTASRVLWADPKGYPGDYDGIGEILRLREGVNMAAPGQVINLIK